MVVCVHFVVGDDQPEVIFINLQKLQASKDPFATQLEQAIQKALQDPYKMAGLQSNHSFCDDGNVNLPVQVDELVTIYWE